MMYYNTISLVYLTLLTLCQIRLKNHHHGGVVQAFSQHGFSNKHAVHRRPGQSSFVVKPYVTKNLPTLQMTTVIGNGNNNNNNNNKSSSWLDSIVNGWTNLIDNNKNKKDGNSSSSWVSKVIKPFIDARNDGKNPKRIIEYISDDMEFMDTSLYDPIVGKDNMERHFYLIAAAAAATTNSAVTTTQRIMVMDDTVEEGNKVFVLYHIEELNKQSGESIIIPDSTGMTFYTINDEGFIQSIFDVMEPPSPKPGDAGLNLLKNANKVIDTFSRNKNKMNDDDDDESSQESTNNNMMDIQTKNSNKDNVVESYFNYWNVRDMQSAVNLFAEDCNYDDKQYPLAFSGKEAMKAHLEKVAACLPTSFSFVVDDIIVEKVNNNNKNNEEKFGVQWHVENNGEILPFTRGCSLYTASSSSSSQIQTGIDIPEPAVLKLGSLNQLAIPTLRKYLTEEPIRIVPFVAWVAYMYIVFVSEGILPGANALALEQRTWEEVRDLSLNFAFVAPTLNLPFAPTVHPMLEGIFNLLLSWAALFSGFLSDERKNKPNLFLPMGIIVIGMQFLTSAFLLPYLALRSSEPSSSSSSDESVVYKEDIQGDIQAIVSEWRWLGLTGGIWGLTAIFWAFFARYDEYGDFHQRYASLIDLLSIDRVGSSFVVDLVIFGLFQCWFIDDDWNRRQSPLSPQTNDGDLLRNIGKFVPFFGLVTYFTLRPALPSREDDV